VGVPDPYDDSIIWWGTIEEGQPPKQIVDTGEFFVLKKVEASDGHGGHSLHWDAITGMHKLCVSSFWNAVFGLLQPQQAAVLLV
jgi:hypothetical protein